MRGILADNNVQGQVEILRLIVEGEYWREVWTALGLSVYTFADVGLVGETPDDILWRLCQQQELVLVTANRNKDGPDSLETTIENENTPRSLPVLTLADSERVRHSRSYAEQVANRLMAYLFDIANYRGTGRLYLP